LTNQIIEEVARLLGKRAHDVGHAATEFGHTVMDIEHAAASRLRALRGEKPHSANVNDKPAN